MKHMFFAILLLASLMKSEAKVVLPVFLSDNAILQQKSKVFLYGSAEPDKKVKIFTSWNKKTIKVKADKDGKFSKSVMTPAAGGPYYITFDDGSVTKLNNILIGEVWFCSGQSNMAMTMTGGKNQPVLNSEEIIKKSTNGQIRIFTIGRKASDTPLEEVKGNWNEASPAVVAKSSAVAYQFAQMLQQKLQVPVGVIISSWGGTPIRAWMSAESLKGIADKEPVQPDKPAKNPSTLYNGMVAPFVNFTIRGVLWYQGEADRQRVEQYRKMMSAMVSDWRTKFNSKDMPFYYVQIAPWTYGKDKGKDPVFLFREMQYDLSKTIPNTGIAVTADVGSKKTIHPPDKTSVAERLLKVALARTYGFTDEKYLGPEFKNIEIRKDKALVRFDHAEEGLVVRPGETDNFEIAGKDGKYYKADFKVTDEGIEVWSKDVAVPVAIRYGFKNYFQGNIFNKEGLPATPFRTDKQ